MGDPRSSNNGSDDAPLCANNCGSYGNSRNRNLCSVCFAAFLKESDEHFRRTQNSNHFVRGEELNLRKRQSPTASESSEASQPNLKIRNRCRICSKKVGLLGFNCRCGNLFCGRHRYPETHSCDVDYQAIGREILAKQIVPCKADKLEFRI